MSTPKVFNIVLEKAVSLMRSEPLATTIIWIFLLITYSSCPIGGANDGVSLSPPLPYLLIIPRAKI